MKERRTVNLISFTINVLIIVITIYAISCYFRNDIIWEYEYFDFKRWKCLRYFTNLSNVYAAVSAVIIAVFNFTNVVRDRYFFPKWAIAVKYSACVSVTVTFMTVVFFLGPVAAFSGNGYFSLFKQSNFYLHFLTPILAVISFLFFERGEKISFKYAFYGLLPTVLYSVIYVIMVVFVGSDNGGWPDFYGFTFGGRMWAVPISVIVMYAATFAFSLAERFLHNKICAKKEYSCES